MGRAMMWKDYDVGGAIGGRGYGVGRAVMWAEPLCRRSHGWEEL